MARADSISTTRRTFVRLAASAAGAALTPAAAAPAEDAELIRLSERLIYATVDLNAAIDRSAEDEAQALYAQGSAIFDQIWGYQATTLAGVQAKCRALIWLHGDDAELWDCKYCFDLVEDVVAIAATAGR